MKDKATDSRRVIAMAADDQYLWPLACSLFSALSTTQTEITFLIANVNGLLSPQGIRLANELLTTLGASGYVMDVNVDVGKVKRFDWNATVYARLGLLDLLDERFLWLDSDTLLRPGWDEIFKVSDELFDDASLVACAVMDRPATLEPLRRSGTNQAYSATKGNYFNAGVIAADPGRWRAAGFASQWRDLVATQDARGFTYLDQDVLNFILAGKVGFLSGAFNHIASEPTMGDEKILHFAGYPKPWKLDQAGRAFFVATEALNVGRPQHQVSGGGTAWQLFPLYWDQERFLEQALIDSKRPDLADDLQARLAAQLIVPTFKERAKLQALRFFARKLLCQ